MAALKATEKLERLLAMIPWIIENDGPYLSLISERFQYPIDALLNDLTKVLFMVGPYPHTPDTLIEVLVEDERVWIEQADYLSRPMQFTPVQGFSILRKAKTMALKMGNGNGSDLNSAIAKLESALGQNARNFDINIPEFASEHYLTIEKALVNNVQIQVEYYAYSKDETSIRTVHPVQMVNRDHHHYLYAYCENAKDFRLFRMDRILSVVHTSNTNNFPTDPTDTFDSGTSWDFANDGGTVVTLMILPVDAWIVSTYPTERVIRHDDGKLEVDFVVTGIAWLKRLLLRIHPETLIVNPSELVPHNLSEQAAKEIINRYKECVSDDTISASLD
jgi:proteasome accessory factor C